MTNEAATQQKRGPAPNPSPRSTGAGIGALKTRQGARLPAWHQSPLLLLFVVATSIFVVEGAIMLAFHLLAPFSPAEEGLVDAAALTALLFPILSLVIFRPLVQHIRERRQAEEALSREAAVNAGVAEISKALIESRPVDDISEIVLGCAKRLTDSATGFVGYIDPQTGHLVCPTHTKEAWDACKMSNKTIVFDMFVGVWGWVLINRKPLLTNSLADDPRSSGVPPGHVPIERFLSAPALIGETLVGQIAVANTARDYTERDLYLIERLAALYALAVQRKRAEEALRESEERFRTLSASSPIGIFLADAEGNNIYSNERLLTISGLTHEESQGSGWYRAVHPDDREAVHEEVSRAAREGRELCSEYRVLTPQGTERWVYSRAVGILSEKGEWMGNVGTVEDITERKRAEEALRESEEKYRDLVENINDVIYELDADGRITYISPALQVSGYNPGDVVGHSFTEFVHPDDVLAIVDSFQKGLSGKPEPSEYRIAFKSGEIHWVRSFSRPVFEGDRVIGLRAVLTDITDRKQAEEALQKAREELEAKVEHQMLRRNPYGLTFRELTVLHLVASGRSDKEIGAELGISHLTAQKHLENIRNKMDVASRTEASVRAVREGILN